MKAAVFHGPNQDMTIEQVDIDSPLEREVLVRKLLTPLTKHLPAHLIRGVRNDNKFARPTDHVEFTVQ